MGYNTRYALAAEYAPHKTPDKVVGAFVASNEDARYCLTPSGDTNDSGKWYGHEADLLALSKAHPHLLFTLEGEGEESGDIWKKYFCAGKIQVAKAERAIGVFFRFPRRPMSPAGFSVVSCGLSSTEARDMFAEHTWIPYCFQRTRIPGAAIGRVFLTRLTPEERAADGGYR